MAETVYMHQTKTSLTRRCAGWNFTVSVEDGDAPGIVWAWVTMNREDDKREWSASYACARDTGELSSDRDCPDYTLPDSVYRWLESERVEKWLAEAGY